MAESRQILNCGNHDHTYPPLKRELPLPVREQIYKEVEEEQIGKRIPIDEAISSPKHDHMKSVVRPEHYVGKRMEVIDVIDAFDLNAYEANIVKYVLRYKKKNGLEDLKKAEWYLTRLINKLKQENPPF